MPDLAVCVIMRVTDALLLRQGYKQNDYVPFYNNTIIRLLINVRNNSKGSQASNFTLAIDNYSVSYTKIGLDLCIFSCKRLG
jgi:hypothetical protein